MENSSKQRDLGRESSERLSEEGWHPLPILDASDACRDLLFGAIGDLSAAVAEDARAQVAASCTEEASPEDAAAMELACRNARYALFEGQHNILAASKSSLSLHLH